MDILGGGCKLSCLYCLDYLNYAVIYGSFNAALSSEIANHSVNSINLAGLIILKVLKHGGLDIAVLLHCDRKKEGCKGALSLSLIIEELYDILSLDGSKHGTCSVTDVDTFLHTADSDLSCILIFGNVAKYAANNCTKS